MYSLESIGCLEANAVSMERNIFFRENKIQMYFLLYQYSVAGA